VQPAVSTLTRVAAGPRAFELSGFAPVLGA
jgi:hypothetical protein